MHGVDVEPLNNRFCINSLIKVLNVCVCLSVCNGSGGQGYSSDTQSCVCVITSRRTRGAAAERIQSEAAVETDTIGELGANRSESASNFCTVKSSRCQLHK